MHIHRNKVRLYCRWLGALWNELNLHCCSGLRLHTPFVSPLAVGWELTCRKHLLAFLVHPYLESSLESLCFREVFFPLFYSRIGSTWYDLAFSALLVVVYITHYPAQFLSRIDVLSWSLGVGGLLKEFVPPLWEAGFNFFLKKMHSHIFFLFPGSEHYGYSYDLFLPYGTNEFSLVPRGQGFLCSCHGVFVPQRK